MVKKFVNHSTVKLNWIVALAAVGFSMPAMAQKAAKPKKKAPVAVAPVAPNVAAQRLAMYKKCELKTDTALLSTAERECITHLIKAAEYADRIFWKQTIGDKSDFLAGIKDPNERKFAEVNYGPWDRLNND
ncbi:MAG: Zn-dependent hydrolase, partial [Bacteroidota bacterium]